LSAFLFLVKNVLPYKLPKFGTHVWIKIAYYWAKFGEERLSKLA